MTQQEIAILTIALVIAGLQVWTWVTVHSAASLLADYLEAKRDAGEWPQPPEARRDAGDGAGRDASWAVDR